MYEEEKQEAETDSEKSKLSFKKKLGGVTRNIYDVVETLVIAFAIVVFIYLFIASPHEVIGKSMEDNFYNGEYLLADKISYRFKEPRPGDVVIFKQTDTADYIKRIIGTPGDTVEIRDGYIFVNGHQLDESEYLDDNIYTDGGSFLPEGKVFTVPDGKLFVCGDNRGASSDSRSFGAVNMDKIKGRAVLIYWPLSHLKVVKRPSYNN